MPSMDTGEFRILSGVHHYQQQNLIVVLPLSPIVSETAMQTIAADENDNADLDNSGQQKPPSNQSAAKTCRGCSAPIFDRFLLEAMDFYWHTGCLRCSTCGTELGDVGSMSCYSRAGLVLCRNDYIRLFGSSGTCDACRQLIPAGQYVMKVRDDVVYHVDCFRCSDCGVRLVPGDRFALDNTDGRGIVCQRDHLHRRHQQQQLITAAEAVACPAGRTCNKLGLQCRQAAACMYTPLISRIYGASDNSECYGFLRVTCGRESWTAPSWIALVYVHKHLVALATNASIV